MKAVAVLLSTTLTVEKNSTNTKAKIKTERAPYSTSFMNSSLEAMSPFSFLL